METFDIQSLPGLLRREEQQKIFRDARGVIFPCARATELHGGLPILEGNADIPELRHFLQGAYRFGAPVAEGFHHDAQLDGGRRFSQMEFDCSRDGLIPVTASHASIYPNDYVRPGT